MRRAKLAALSLALLGPCASANEPAPAVVMAHLVVYVSKEQKGSVSWRTPVVEVDGVVRGKLKSHQIVRTPIGVGRLLVSIEIGSKPVVQKWVIAVEGEDVYLRLRRVSEADFYPLSDATTRNVFTLEQVPADVALGEIETASSVSVTSSSSARATEGQ